MTRGMTRRRAVAAVLVVALAAGVLGPLGDTRALADPVAGGPPGQPVWVTLITGDRVSLVGTGKRAGVRVDAAPRGRAVPFQDFVRNGDRYVLPGDAAGLVRSGVVDRELFNVSGLIRQGYDDARTPNVPLLVQYAEGATPAAVPEGAKVRRALPGLAMTAVDQQKARSRSFWSGLSAGGAKAEGTGVRKVWLNRRVRASLDQSVPQIGAPTAWQQGFTGRGVQVAVLDTGIDTDHPDLAGKVAQQRDFSGTGSVEDGHGHGTHVASTITGSGAASGNRYRGVAPDAVLAVGKVLDDTGFGTVDSVLAGMQWAAAEARAKVVGMSLGAGPSDGTDPMSAAVNALSRQYGTLFVIAAGNFGADETVSTPAAADDALAVASVSKQDALSPFSSRGPRPGDGALKPEIAAPGADIVAARPAGVEPIGEPVGEAYQRASGTSMATPHVAGAAAILAQQHPDWAGDTLKAALMSSAREIAAGPLAVGAGRVDVARATSATVIATGSASAFLPWPNSGARQRRTVTWTNTGSTPVTLDLRVNLTGGDGTPAPEGLLTLPATSVTVPAGGSTPVELTITAQNGQPGTWAGILTASGPDGTAITRTALSIRQQEPTYTLTASVLNRNGSPPEPGDRNTMWLVDLDTGDLFAGDPGTYRLPRGRYGVQSVIETARPGREPSVTVIAHPELVLDHDVTQVFDARTGHPVSAEPDNAAARGGTQAMNVLSTIRACECVFGLLVDFDPRFQQGFAATLPGTASDSFAFAQARRATEPVLELVANDGQPFDVFAMWTEFAPPAEQATLPVVYGGAGTVEELSRIDANGKLVLLELGTDLLKTEWPLRAANVRSAGGRLTMIKILDGGPGLPPGGAATEAEDDPPFLLTFDSVTADRFAALVKAGGTMLNYVNRPSPNHRYELAQGVAREVTAAQVYRPRTRDLAALRSAYHDNVAGEVRYGGLVEMFGRPVGTGFTQPVAAQQERTEYFTPGTWEVFWSSALRGDAFDTVTLAAGRPARVGWNKAVAGPTFRGLTQEFFGQPRHPWAWRKDGVLDVRLPMYGDSAGRPRAADDFFFPATGSVSLSRDGTPVGTAPITEFADFAVPDQASSYRLSADAHRSDGDWQLSTTVTAEWTFRSSSADEGKALPLLTARFDPNADLRNRAPGGRAFSFPAYVERQGGNTRITSFTVDVSYDDGASWRPATVRKDRDHWKVSVRHPRTGHASLRARATDVDGNTVEQTILRAYQIC